MNKNVPNYLSVLRILLSISLFFIPVMNIPFMIVYILCFLTDILDGYLARKYGCVSDLGRKLDSLGDLAYILMFLFVILPWMNPSMLLIVLAIICFAIKIIPFIITRLILGKFDTFHNKISKIGFGGLVFIPFLFEIFGEPILYVELAIMYAAVFMDGYITYGLYKKMKEESSTSSDT